MITFWRIVDPSYNCDVEANLLIEQYLRYSKQTSEIIGDL